MDREYISKSENAVVAIRVSSIKQGLQGDSPQAQQEQIERFAEAHKITIKKFFVFMESASKDQQPVQEAIDYCKNPKNDIQLFIIKSIDRFTRGGSFFYDQMKAQLTRYKVKLVDIYGIIGTQEVNTLEHLGVKFDWSVYSPTKKSEILEAERAKDEMRDIMSRMIGAEIRYVRLGYRVRTAPFGYVNEKVDTPHGKRVIHTPHPEESQWIFKMYEMRIMGTMRDEQIVDKLNKLGFMSRKMLIRNPKDRTVILGEKGGNKLNVKQFQDYIKNTLYAGVSYEKWTKDEPIKCKFNGLVTIETFNKANKGKIIIVEEDGAIKVYKDKPADWRLKKSVKNPDFPYKRFIVCPKCEQPLYGSASRGKMGKYYPAYHCNKRGHYFRVPVAEFEETIKNFVQQLKITQEGIEKAKGMVKEEWDKRISTGQKESSMLNNKILELQTESKALRKTMNKMSSDITLKYMEQDMLEIEGQIAKLEENRHEKDDDIIDMELASEITGYFLEHLGNLLLESPNPLDRASYFGMIFEKAPTYDELKSGTPRLAPYIELVSVLSGPNSFLARPEGFEPPA